MEKPGETIAVVLSAKEAFENKEGRIVLYLFVGVRLLDVKQGQNKEGKTVLYLVFEYMDTDLKNFIRSFRQTGQNIPPPTIKLC